MSGLTQAGLCEGYGGISMAVADVLGAELVWYCEYEPPTEKNPKPSNAAARLLAHRHPDISNHGDLTVVDWPQVQRVDVLTGGWPCQPFSSAGRQKGAADERAIWPFVARAVRDLRPRIVVLENVPNIIAMGELGRAVGDLAGLGYVGSWRCVRASDVGAPHQRRRIFIVAADPDQLRPQDRELGQPGWAAPLGRAPDPHTARLGRRPSRGDHGVRAEGLVPGHAPVADPSDLGHERDQDARDRRSGSAHGGGPAPNPDGAGRERPTAHSRARGTATGSSSPFARARGRGGVAAHTSGVGRREGRPQPARFVGGPDAAQRGPRPPADADCGPVREQPVPLCGGDGQARPRRDLAATPHPDRDGLAVVGEGAGLDAWDDADGRGPDGVAWGAYRPAILRWGGGPRKTRSRSDCSRQARRQATLAGVRGVADGPARRARGWRPGPDPQPEIEDPRQRRGPGTSGVRDPAATSRPADVDLGGCGMSTPDWTGPRDDDEPGPRHTLNCPVMCDPEPALDPIEDCTCGPDDVAFDDGGVQARVDALLALFERHAPVGKTWRAGEPE